MIRILIIFSFILAATTALAKETPRIAEGKPLYCTDDTPPKCFQNKDDLIELEVIFRSLNFEHVVSGDTFIASGKIIRIWAINAPSPNNPASLASKWLLEGLLNNNQDLTCKLIDINAHDEQVMHCFTDGLDLGSMMVQVGMATAAEDYYDYEQEIAQKGGRGLWKAATMASVSASAEAIKAVSFNIQFLGNFKDKKNKALADILAGYDLIFVQELVAPPYACTFPDGTACKPDPEAAVFFDAMKANGFEYILSPEDSGTGDTIHLNSAATEWWVAFYKSGRVAPAVDLPNGFLADDRSNNTDYERVPYAFAFRFDGKTDAVFISTHLQPGHSKQEQKRRAHELSTIFNWISGRNSAEKDFIVLGDMNIDDCDELAAVLPEGYESLNRECLSTNTSKNDPRPYDHVMYSAGASGSEIGGFFEVINLMEAVKPFWDETGAFPGDPYIHDDFRSRYSDHHPVRFRLNVVGDDD